MDSVPPSLEIARLDLLYSVRMHSRCCGLLLVLVAVAFVPALAGTTIQGQALYQVVRQQPSVITPIVSEHTQAAVAVPKAPDATSAPTPDWAAGTWPSPDANLDNTVRNFILPAAAVLRVAGV